MVVSVNIQYIYFTGMLPDRPNIFLEVGGCKRFYNAHLLWLLKEIKEAGVECPKIIYCPNINQVAKLHEWLMASLGGYAWTDNIEGVIQGERSFEKRLICQYHKSIGAAHEQQILETFHRSDSTLRVLVSTVAFGIGVNISDIQYVIHWGLSQSVAHYWQEVGRCAMKYSYNGKATLYPVRLQKDNKLGELLKSYYKVPMCFRRLILSQFVISGIDLSAIKASTPEVCNLKCADCACKMCLCCTYCKSQCPCILLLL